MIIKVFIAILDKSFRLCGNVPIDIICRFNKMIDFSGNQRFGLTMWMKFCWTEKTNIPRSVQVPTIPWSRPIPTGGERKFIISCNKALI